MKKLAGRRVKLYRNLAKSKLGKPAVWSVWDYEKKKVVAHVHFLALKNCIFKVSEKGRQRVLRQQRRNVHAYVSGVVDDVAWASGEVMVSYNPYSKPYFYNKKTGKKVEAAKSVYATWMGLLADGVV